MKYALGYLMELYIIFTSVSEYMNQISTAEFIVYDSTKLVPVLPSSLIESRQLISPRSTSITGCALVCTNTIQCIVAVYSKFNQVCSIYRSNGAFRGNFIAGTSYDFVIVLNRRSPNLSTISMNITIHGVWNTLAQGDSQYSYPGSGIGNYWPTQKPEDAFDGNNGTTYCNHGPCGAGLTLTQSCGTQTGLFFTYPWVPVILKAFRIVTGFNALRDPLWVTIEGSNQNSSILNRGSSWILIYNGTSGLDVDPGRKMPGQYQQIQNVTAGYSSYRFLTQKKRGIEICTEIADIELVVP